MSQDLTLAFTKDVLGDLVAKAPQGGMIAAATYLLFTQPPEDDPCASAYSAALHGLNMARTTFLSNAKHIKEKVVADRSLKGNRSQRRHRSSWQVPPHEKRRGYDARDDIAQKKVDRARTYGHWCRSPSRSIGLTAFIRSVAVAAVLPNALGGFARAASLVVALAGVLIPTPGEDVVFWVWT
jgi:hypothetical protein